MKTILIVDDEPRLLQSIQAGLKIHQNSFSVKTALNGKEAVSCLSSEQIDLVITDLKMPEMDGFELLAYITSHYPSLPTIVMTAFSTPEIERKIEETSLKLLEKPIDFDELAQSIFESLEQTNEVGSLTGISLPSFLQLLETERKTCLIEVRSGEHKGYIYFNNGELTSAVFDGTKGDEAVYGMLMFDDIDIRLKKQVKRRFKKTIEKPLLALLMEGMQRKDEKLNPSENEENQATPDIFSSEEETTSQGSGRDNKNQQKGDYNMKEVKESLGRLADVEGFMAVGIFTPNGEMAVSINNAGLKLDELGSLANDVLLKAQTATSIISVAF